MSHLHQPMRAWACVNAIMEFTGREEVLFAEWHASIDTEAEAIDPVATARRIIANRKRPSTTEFEFGMRGARDLGTYRVTLAPDGAHRVRVVKQRHGGEPYEQTILHGSQIWRRAVRRATEEKDQHS